MLLKDGESFFNDPVTGLRKILSDIVSGWTVPSVSGVDPLKVGQPLENIPQLLSEVDSIITSEVYNKWNNYKVAITNGSIFIKFKSTVLSLYTFATYKEGMKTKDGPQFDLPNPDMNANISWLSYDIGNPNNNASWFSFELIDNPNYVSGGMEYPISASGSLITSSSVTAFGQTIQSRINVDLDFLDSINSSVANNSSDLMIYFIFKKPETIPLTKPLSDYVLYDYGVLNLASLMNWQIKGITT